MLDVGCWALGHTVDGMNAMQDNDLCQNVAEEYPDYLRDESRRVGTAESISFPKTEDEIRDHLARARSAGESVTVQGARTGIAGGAVPDGGHVLSLSRMTAIPGIRYDEAAGTYFVRVQPGVVLADLRAALDKKEFDTDGWSDESLAALERLRGDGDYFFPPDPTETSASIGGMVAANASGARSFHYGATRCHVNAMRVVLGDGSVLALARGEQKAAGREFSVQTTDKRGLAGKLPAYDMPKSKNAAGYFVQDDMDVLDVFIGAEGTLGIISEVELKLAPSPAAMWGIMMFFPLEEQAVEFVGKVRMKEPKPVAIEFFDHNALDLLREEKENPAFSEIPEPPAGAHTAIYVEYHGPDEETVETAVMEMSEIMTEYGGDEDTTWLACDDREMLRLKNFRHTVPESVNLRIDERRKKEPALTKLGTDLAVGDECLGKILAMYHSDLDAAGLQYVIFGHIGDNHVHVNILPNSLEEYESGKRLYLRWAHEAVAMGGTISGEHGVGKLKTALFREMYGEESIRQMQALKQCFDPDRILNPGNLFGT